MASESSGKSSRSDKVRPRIGRGQSDRSRLLLFLLFNLVERIDVVRRGAFGGDLDLASIIHATSQSVIEPAMRDAAWREKFGSLDKVVGAAGQRGVNALSIAQATGIPRETARRKIKKLIAMGALTELARGEYIVTPGYLQRLVKPEHLDEFMVATLRFMNDGLDQGVYDWADRPE